MLPSAAPVANRPSSYCEVGGAHWRAVMEKSDPPTLSFFRRRIQKGSSLLSGRSHPTAPLCVPKNSSVPLRDQRTAIISCIGDKSITETSEVSLCQIVTRPSWSIASIDFCGAQSTAETTLGNLCIADLRHCPALSC